MMPPKRRVMGIAVDTTARREHEEALRVYEGLKSQYNVLAGQMGPEAADNAVAQAYESVKRAGAAMRSQV